MKETSNQHQPKNRPIRIFAVVTILFWCASLVRCFYYLSAVLYLGFKAGDLTYTSHLLIHMGVPALCENLGLMIPSCVCASVIYRFERPWAFLGIIAMSAIALWRFFLSNPSIAWSLIHNAIKGRPVYILPTIIFTTVFDLFLLVSLFAWPFFYMTGRRQRL
jgi:hypothetical protein